VPHTAGRTTLISALFGLVAAGAAAFLVPPMFLPLIFWDVTALVYLVATWVRIGRLDAEATAAEAKREDPSRAGADLGILIAAVASLVAVGFVIVVAGKAKQPQLDLDVGLSVASVVASWALVHTIYTLRYARLYYGDNGGVDNHQKEPPCFTDFAYLAFTVGMTFQVSDSEVTTSKFRAMVLRHALLAYLFGTVIIALTINLVAGLSH
jgi:uncharacterized membrane protein